MSDDLTPQTNEISLREYLDLLRRRKYIVIQTFVIVMMVGAIVTFMTKPTYRTGARILVEGKEYTVANYNTSDPLSNLFMPDVGHDIATQIEVLQSNKVLSEAFTSAGVLPQDVKLDIKQVGTTDVIEITAESTNPTSAERIAHWLPDIYAKYMSGNRDEEIAQALTSSRSRLQKEKEDLAKAETKLEQFKQRTKLPDITADKSQKISDAGSAEADLHRAQMELATAQARLNAVVADRRKQPDFIETPTTTSNNAARQAIIDHIAQLKADRSRATFYYKEGTFQINQFDDQITREQDRLDHTPENTTVVTRTPNPALPNYDQKVSDAQATVNADQAQLAKAQVRAESTKVALTQYSNLDHQMTDIEREREEHDANVRSLTQTVSLLDTRESFKHDPLMTITPSGPAEKVSPRPMVNLAYAAIVGLILALGLALLQEFLDDRINAPEDARRMFPTPILGYVPLIEKEEGRLLSQSRSSGSILESYRVLRSNVRFATVGSSVTSLVVTSTVPGEGKSVTATNLAVAMAIDGRRVILVDADLRRPTIHTKLGLFQSPGVTNVLVGNTTLESALRDTSIPGLRVLTAGPLPPNPAELLNSEPMQRLHERLKEHADIVIYDSPPCLATADAQVLASSADGVLYVVQLGETKKSAVRHAMELLNQAHANVLGLVFNKVEVNSGQNNYYGYYGYYQATALDDQPRRRSSSEFEAMMAKNGNGHDETVDLTVAAVQPKEITKDPARDNHVDA